MKDGAVCVKGTEMKFAQLGRYLNRNGLRNSIPMS